MDTDVLFILALVGFYLFRQIASRRKAAAPKPKVDRREAEPQFDEALDEIRRSLGLGPAPPPEPEPRPAPVQRSAPMRTAPSRQRPSDEFHPVDSDRPVTKSPLENTRFTFHDPLAGHTHAETFTAVTPAPPVPSRRRWLATKQQLRDAFILKEIVGPPRARKREIR